MKTILKKRDPTFMRGETRGRETSQKVFTLTEAYGIGPSVSWGWWKGKERELVCLFIPFLLPKNFR